MNSGDQPFIWQAPDGPRWRYDQASLAALTDDVLKTSEIEGERLDAACVRSSIAWRHRQQHRSADAPAPVRLARGIVPNRIRRPDQDHHRHVAHFYSLSAQIQRERNSYYYILERTQRADLDITHWLAWFLAMLHQAIERAHRDLDTVLLRARFWQRMSGAALNARQAKVLNRLIDGFEGKLTSSKWAALAKCSPDTALRDIQDLVSRGILVKSNASGRSTSYELSEGPPRNHGHGAG